MQTKFFKNNPTYSLHSTTVQKTNNFPDLVLRNGSLYNALTMSI